jgi:hypothetical protein
MTLPGSNDSAGLETRLPKADFEDRVGSNVDLVASDSALISRRDEREVGNAVILEMTPVDIARCR